MAIDVKTEQPGKSGAAPAARTNSRVRRCLFGRPSDAERSAAMSDWNDHERLIADEQRRKWNFDFETMTPLPGRWQWEPVRRRLELTPPVPPRDLDAAAGPTAPTDEPSAPAVDSGTAATSAVDTTPTSCDNALTGGTTTARRKRRRQTTINGSISCRLILPLPA